MADYIQEQNVYEQREKTTVEIQPAYLTDFSRIKPNKSVAMHAVLSTREQNISPLTTLDAGVIWSGRDICRTVALTDEKKTAVVRRLSEVADAPSAAAFTMGSPRFLFSDTHLMGIVVIYDELFRTR